MRFNVRFTQLAFVAIVLTATALAANPPAGACIYALDPTAHRSFQIAGSTSVTASCSAVVSSTASDAFEMEGSETLFLQNHSQVGVVGGWQLNGQTSLKDTISNQTILPFVITAPSDPLAAIAAPNSGTIVSGSHVNYDMNNKPANNTLAPGVYCGGLGIGNTGGVNFALSPGTYVMAGGGLVINSQAKVTGTGVTIYNTSSTGWGCSGSSSYTPINIDGQANVTMSAPASGALAGILLFGNRTGCATLGACQNTIQGGSTTALDGALYFKSDTLLFSGANSSSGYMMLVADIIHVNGNSTFGVSGNPINGISVTIAPGSASLSAGQTQQFSATVANTGYSAVTWTISPVTSGSITAGGLYTAPATIASQTTVTLTATSVADPSKKSTASITLNPPALPISVTVSPATVSLGQSGTQTFTANVANSSNQSVTWTVTGGGAIDLTGKYTAPASITAAGTATVKATSAADTTKSGTATVTLTPPPISVTVSPATVTLSQGGTQTFAATVVNSTNQTVTWLVSGGGTIDSTGKYTAPATIAAVSTATVTATSVADASKSSTATITLSPPPISVTVSPATVTLIQGGTQTFAATVINSTNQAVTWTATGGGTIDSTGKYTAPASITVAATATVKATSAADTTKSATATVTLNPPPISVTVAPPRATVSAGGGTQTFSATVTGSTNQAVTWSVPVGQGTIDSTGKYTAPATVPSSSTITVTATSAVDTTKTATATVTIPPVSVSVTPTTASATAGSGPQTFAAVVAGTPNQAVTWSVPAGQGTIDATGKYTPPATVPANSAVVVTATSVVDSTKSATATVTVVAPTSITVAPLTATVSAGGGTQTFTATVTGSTNQAVTWSVPTGQGTIDSTGKYTAPATVPSSSTITVTATSAVDTTKTATATVTIPPVSVSVTPTTASATAGSGPQTFAAVVAGTPNQAVTWSVPAGQGTIDATGKYTPPATVPANSAVVVTATSVVDSTKSATATVTVVAPTSITVAPLTATVSAGGGTQTFTATVTGSTNQAVTWSVPAGQGRIDSTGKYTAPATVPANAAVPVTATSAADPTKTATATATIIVPAVTPATITLAGGSTQSFAANFPATWTLSGAGTISAAGLYTGPAALACASQTATVTATLANSTITAAATVTVSPLPLPAGWSDLDIGSTATAGSATYNCANTTFTVSGQGTDVYSLPDGLNFAYQPLVGDGTIIGRMVSVASTFQYSKIGLMMRATLDPATPYVFVHTQPNNGGVTVGVRYTATQNPGSFNNTGGPQPWFKLVRAGDAFTPYTSSDGVIWIAAGGPVTVSMPATIYAGMAVTAVGGGLVTTTFDNISVTEAPITVTVAPGVSSASAGQTQQFTATLRQTVNQAVLWSINPASGAGSIGASTGLYAAPAAVGAQQTVTVTATSVADPSKSATASLTLLPTPAITPSATSINAGQTLQLISAITPVTWSVTGGGTISATGLYTAPAFVTAQQSVTITAVSTLDPTKTATAAVTVLVVPAISPNPVTVISGATQQFTANFAANWSVSAGAGTISASGLYSPPAGVCATGQTATITATLQGNPATTATAAVTIAPSTALPAGWADLDIGSTPTAGSATYNCGTSTFTISGQGSDVYNLPDGFNYAYQPFTGDGTITARLTNLTSAFPYTRVGIMIRATAAVSSPYVFMELEPNNNVAPSLWIRPTATQALPDIYRAAYASGPWVRIVRSGNTFFGYSSPDGVNWQIATFSNPTAVMPATVLVGFPITSNGNGLATATFDNFSAVGAPVTISMTPATAVVSAGQTQQFAVAIGNSFNTGVNYTLSGAGTISAAGLYTPPAAIAAQQTVKITAASAADPSKTTVSTVTLLPTPVVAPTSVTLNAAQSQQFTSPLSPVVWTTNTGAPGTLSASGLYAAPLVIAAPQTVTVTATSALDPTRIASSIVTLWPPVSVTVTPSVSALSATQTLQLASAVLYSTNTGVTWTVNGPGSVSATGVYTAPASVTGVAMATVIATSVADPTKSASLTITLGASNAVGISPSAPVVVPGQSQQFITSVAGPNQAVTYTLSPATGVGSISAGGLYTAPTSICAQQAVTVTATSVADPTQKAIATLVVSNANGYSNQRTLTINHTKVPNSDLANFPVLISGTYPFLATTTNGGKVVSPSAYDVIFTSDIGCRTKLNHEVDTWNSATGQFSAWVQVPLVSHTADTPVYMCYRNAAISTDQSAPKAVWDSAYEGVWHFGANGSTLVAADSTTNTNGATALNGTSPLATGKIGTGASFNGANYIDFPSTASLNTYTALTVSLWVNAAPGANNGYYSALVQKGFRGSEWAIAWDNFGPGLSFQYPGAQNTGSGNASDNQWHKVDMTVDLSGLMRSYVDGVLTGANQGSGATGGTALLRLGAHEGEYGNAYVGLADELRISNYARTADWITTEFNNQGSPSTFYTVSAETGETLSVSPSVISLSSNQTQQFSAALPTACGTTVTWTVAGLGAVSSTGLYTAPSSIASQTTATVTATTASGQFISAVITLLAAESITLTPATVTLYGGESQQFTGLVTNAANTSVTYTNPSGIGTLAASGLYTAPANISTVQTITITATSADGTKTASANVILSPGQGVPLTETKVAHVVSIIAGSLCRREHLAPVVDPGGDITTSLACQGASCQAGASLNGAATNYTLAPGTTTLSYAWTVVTGPAAVVFANQTSPSTTATFTAAGNYTLQLSAFDGSATGSAMTHVTVNPPITSNGYTFLISPAATGPIGVGGPVTIGLQLSGLFTGGGPVTLTISGANPATVNLNANNNGFVSYTYYGRNAGVDTINGSATGTCCAPTFSSNTATVGWINEPVKLTSSPVSGRFYTADGSGVFNTLANATPVFTQVFPNINFNAGGTLARPFTDIATDYTGAVVGPIPAQGNNAQAGVGTMYNFSAIFTGTFSVPAAGQVTFNFTSDDAFIFGIGGGTSYVSGVKTNTPALTTLQGLPVMGGVNQREAPTANAITVNFPAAGTYSYEVDYVKGGDKNLTLTMQSSGAPIVPSAILTLVPAQSGSIHTGSVGTWNITATDYDGAALATIPVTVNVVGINQQTRTLTTDPTGKGSVSYQGTNIVAGSDQIQAQATVNGTTIYSNVASVNWNAGTNAAPVVSAGTPQTIILPAQAVLTGTATDDGLPTNTLTLTWTKLSGPGTVTFDNASQAVTAASFSVAGSYVLQLSATDGTLTTNSTVAITTVNNPNWSSGWLANPLDKSTITQPVPVSLITGITLTNGTLQYWPVNAPQSAVTLNANTTGTGNIATFDPTLLNNGNYFIVLSATNNLGASMTSQVYVTVAGDYKPGRVTATVTDLKVPATGLPITISRTYDSLMRNQSMDFGYGWRLGIQVQMDVSSTYDVTFTVNGQRRTFYFTPDHSILGYYTPRFTAEPGFYGKLTATNDNCSGLLIRVGNIYQCGISNSGSYTANGFSYQPGAYVYTDAYGRVYTVGPDGQIQSLKDLNNNTLTVSPTGISSTTGLSVPFVRDTQGRITKITDPLGNAYNYAYDVSGNLSTLTLPPSPPTVLQPVTYTYDATHLLTSEKDARGNSGTTTYYTDGKLKSVTDAANQTTSYVYDTTINKTTVTNPDGGVIVTVADSYGMPLTVTDGINRTTTYTYDASHNKLTEKNAANEMTTFAYDVNGFLTLKQDNLNNRWTYANNAVGGPTSVTDPNVKITNIGYDANFNLSTVTDTIGQLAGFTYTAQGLPLTMVDGNNHSSTYSYDVYGNRTGVIDALSRSTTSIFDSEGRMSSQTDPRGNKTQFGYDPLGRKTSMTDANLKVTTYGYDGNGNKTSEKDPLNHTTTYTFDGVNRMTGIQYADATSKSMTYDFRGNKLTEVDQLGRTTKWTYDLAGQLKTMTYAFGTADVATVNYNYDLAGRKISEQDPRGFTTQYGYDTAGRVTSMTDGVGNLTQYGVDPKGQRTSMTDAKGRITNYTYDQRGRLTKTTFVDGKFISKAYDGVGRVLNVTDEESNATGYQYDFANQLKIVTDALSQQTKYDYDLSGNKIAQTDANNHLTSYIFDALNRRTKRTLPAGQFETYAYDDASNKTALTDFNGRTTTYGYDPLNRLTSRTPDASFVGAPAVTFTYTATGKRKTMTDASGTTTYGFDNRDRVISKATPQGTLTYAFDGSNNVNSVVSSNANVTNTGYGWNGVNQLLNVTDNRAGGSGVTNYAYDQINNVSSFAYSNGVTHAFGYDTRYRTTSLNVTNASASVLGSYVQTFSDTGHKKTVAESTGRGENYAYDLIYRLTNETIAGDPVAANNGTLGYGLDPVANRQTLTSTLAALPSQNFTYDSDDRMSVDTYDSNGNTLTSGGVTYTYDFEDRLLSTSSGVQIVYDGDGNRVAATVAGVTTRYLVDEQTPTGYAQVAEEVVGGAVSAQFVYGKMRVSQNRGGVVNFYGYDPGGSTRQLVSVAGAVTDTYSYDAFGNTVAQSGSTVNEFLYRGEQFDVSIGAYYLRARWYRPRIGRFLTRDKIEPTSASICVCARVTPDSGVAQKHLYTYAGADPILLLDRSGYEEEIDYSLLTGNVGRIANAFERRPAEIRKAIHALKRAARGFQGGNPDLLIDLTTGEAYPLTFLADGTVGDSIGNILEFLL